MAGLFLWSAHLREFHFLFFSYHETHRNEHCSNHLHPAEKQSCEICKWDLSLSPALCPQAMEETKSFDFREQAQQQFEDHLSSFACELRSRGPPGGMILT